MKLEKCLANWRHLFYYLDHCIPYFNQFFFIFHPYPRDITMQGK